MYRIQTWTNNGIVQSSPSKCGTGGEVENLMQADERA